MNDEQAIRKLVADWLEAGSDLEKVLGLMAEDVVFLTPGQAPMQGRDAFTVGFRAGLEQYRLEAHSEIQEVQVMGDWAYCWNHLRVVMTPYRAGMPMRRSGNVLSILKKLPEGNWVIFRDANMLTPQNAEG